jgi:hypothetical protein
VVSADPLPGKPKGSLNTHLESKHQRKLKDRHGESLDRRSVAGPAVGYPR